jgi:hypothetical protein
MYTKPVGPGAAGHKDLQTQHYIWIVERSRFAFRYLLFEFRRSLIYLETLLVNGWKWPDSSKKSPKLFLLLSALFRVSTRSPKNKNATCRRRFMLTFED